MVASGVQALDGGQQVVTSQEAKLASLGSVQAREASQTAFQGLSAAQAGAIDREAFPSVFGVAAGGPPVLPEGQSITGFEGPDAALVSLGGSESGAIESTVPMATESSSGQWVPVNLGLREVQGAFEPTNPVVSVRAHRELAGGISLPEGGFVLTPLDGSGAPAGAEGSVSGVTVLYANSERDTDTVVKPTTWGVAVDSVLRSAESPEVLSLRVGLPSGASLEQDPVTGVVRVVREGATLALIPDPSASDAAGRAVPVTMTVAGDVLSLQVADRSGAYQYPIELDPEFTTGSETLNTSSTGSWGFFESGGFTGTKWYGTNLEIHHEAAYANGEWGEWVMQTHGDSQIYELVVHSEPWPQAINEGAGGYLAPSYTTAGVRIDSAGGGVEEATEVPPASHTSERETVTCPHGSCSAGMGSASNQAMYIVSTFGSAGGPIAYYIKALTMYLAQPKETHTTVQYNTSSPTLSWESGTEKDKATNVLDGSGWLSPNSGAFEFKAQDAGLGVNQSRVELDTAKGWEILHSASYGSYCHGLECEPSQSEVMTYKALDPEGALPDGLDTIRVAADDALPNTWSSEHGEGEHVVQVDSTPPRVSVTGLPYKEKAFSMTESVSRISVEVSDGEGKTPSSGVASTEVAVDGHSLGTEPGGCSPGPCTTQSVWLLNGAKLGTGAHTMTVQATDYAGNVVSEDYTLIVRAPSSVSAGPGSVNPETGAFDLSGDDVNLSAGAGALTVARSYNSQSLTAGVEGPFGPQWVLTLGSLAELEVLPDGSVMVVGGTGLFFFEKGASGFEAPEGDSELSLELKESKEYILKDAKQDTTTRFTLPAGATVWVPTVSEGAVASDTTTDTYEVVEVEGRKIMRPTEELAPHAGVLSCSPLARGCRALLFKYATGTSAGEAPTEWGSYNGRLMTVEAALWNPTSKEESKAPVAQYAYDKQGRLRAAWNPQISPALKTVYGYDSEGHVSSVAGPGQQPWMFDYGETPQNFSSGMLLSVTRTPAGTPLGASEAPKDSEAPKLSTSGPLLGQELTVNPGAWANALTYSYQWERCTLGGRECWPITGADNQGYTPVYLDQRRELVARVTAVNSLGAVSATSAASETVPAYMAAPKYASQFGKEGEGAGQLKGPAYDAVVGGYVLVADQKNNRIDVFRENGEYVTSFGSVGTGNGQFKEPVAVAGEEGEPSRVFVADAGNDRVESFSATYTGKVPTYTYNGKASTPAIPADLVAADHELYVAGGADVSEYETYFAGELEFRGSVEDLQKARGIAYHEGELYVSTRYAGKIVILGSGLDQLGEFGGSGSGNGQFNEPTGIGVEEDGDVWVVDSGNHRIQGFSPGGAYMTQFGSEGSGEGQFKGATGIAVSREYIYVVDSGNNRVERFLRGKQPSEISEPAGVPPKVGANSVWSIEYQVPVSGSGAPHEMGSKEVAAWGQTDDPVEATAFYQPDEPMGWPAQDYRRATISYRDGDERTVNVASPAGGISTKEYNATNDVVRTLGAAGRASALAAGTEGGKSEESAKLLDSESVYSEDGTELVESKGPQHKVKLSSGAEVTARSHSHYYYDAGSGEDLGLQTSAEVGAEYEGKESDVRWSSESYAGQEGLGWKLRAPTSTTVDPSGLDLTHTTIYNPKTGEPVERRGPEDPATGGGEAAEVASYTTQFGTKTETISLKEPKADTVDSAGNVWVSNTGGGYIEELTPEGKFVTSLQTKGVSHNVWGIAVDPSENVWALAGEGSRIEEYSSSKDELLQSFGTSGKGEAQFNGAEALALDASGDVWVADSGNNRVQELSSTGKYLRQITTGAAGVTLSDPEGIAVDSSGNVWVADTGRGTVEEFSSTGTYITKYGEAGKGTGQLSAPAGVTVSKAGVIWIADTGNSRIVRCGATLKECSTYGVEGSEGGNQKHPHDLAVEGAGGVWVADTGNNRLLQRSSTGTYLQELKPTRLKAGTFTTPTGIALDHAGDSWVADSSDDRIQEFSPTNTVLKQIGSRGKGEGQLLEPHGLALDSSGDVWVADTANNRIQELSGTGKYLASIPVASPYGVAVDGSGDIWVTQVSTDKVEEFTAAGKLITAFGGEGKEAGQLRKPEGLAVDSSGNVWVADTGNNRIVEFSSTGKVLGSYGTEGEGENQFKAPTALTIDATGHIWVLDSGNDRISEYAAKGEDLGKAGGAGGYVWDFTSPMGIAISSTGSVYVSNSGINRVSVWSALSPTTHETQTIYYTNEANPKVPACGGHPEWEGLICQTQPAKQPEGASQPLPVIDYTYNMWSQVETTTETFGSTKRTKKTTFDAAGRGLTSEVSSSAGQPVPAVTDEYNKETGALEKQAITTAGKTERITSVANSLGELVSYTDADGNTTTYSYDEDGRVTEYGNGEDKQKYAYDTTSGGLKELEDALAGKFTASYDSAGNLTSETYPDGITQKDTRNQLDEQTGIEYTKTAYCGEKCVWYTQAEVPSIHGETLSQTNSLASNQYSYDAAGRLTETQEKTAAEGCVSRIYGYDPESNRTSLTTRKPGSEKCATEGGTTQVFGYDEGGRPDDTGTTYEPLGNITKLPAADAGGSELVTSYYSDGLVDKQAQSSQSIEYKRDPENRTRETVTTTASIITHYPGPGSASAWTSEGANYSCSIPGVMGELAAIDTNGKASIQLHDLQGDIVATASSSETETKLVKTYISTEFGVPTTSSPPPFSWLGADDIASELPTGIISKSGLSYVPQTGRPLQTAAPDLPIPNNTPKEDTPTFAPTTIEAAAAAAAQMDTNAQEALARTIAANAPPEDSLSGPAEEGGGEEEDEGGGGGCTGMRACTASHHSGVVAYHERGNDYAGCSVWASYGTEGGTSGISGEIEIYGHWHCQEAVTMFEMQIALLIEFEGRWIEIGGSYTEHYFDVNGDGGINNSSDFRCGPEHADYDAWIFGRQYDGSYHARWSGWGREARIRTSCHGGVGLPDAP